MRPSRLITSRLWACIFVAQLQTAWAGRIQFSGEPDLTYFVESPLVRLMSVTVSRETEWVPAIPDGGGQPVWFGPRLRIELADPSALPMLIRDSSARLLGKIGPNGYMLEYATPTEAIALASEWATRPGILKAIPVRRNSARLLGHLAPRPNDPFYPLQTHLEIVDRTTSFSPTTPNLNIREAWLESQGMGVQMALGDDGVDLMHPDLAQNQGMWHYNFVSNTAAGSHTAPSQYHGTAVAGLMAAIAGNGIGVAGVAPLSLFSSWVIFDSSDQIAADDRLAAMWRRANNGTNLVAVQNHSWGNSDTDFLGISEIELEGLRAAETFGRGGLGTVIVRAGGNNRARDFEGNPGVGDANLDAYANDPAQIAVAAVNPSGWASSYSSPGACIRVAAPSGDYTLDVDGLTTTDPVGARGANIFVDPIHPEWASYVTGLDGFSGTSGAAPQVAGLTALALAVRPDLSVRDMQQILSISAHHPHLLDPELITNTAGFRLSHSLGFGVPDAGQVMELARRWKVRPAVSTATFTNSAGAVIPDDGYRFQMRLPGSTHVEVDVPVSGSRGIQAEIATPWTPTVTVETSGGTPWPDVSGQAALIHDNPAQADVDVESVAQAGAAFAVLLSDRGGNERTILAGTDDAPIIAAVTSQNDGAKIDGFLATHSETEGRLVQQAAQFDFPVKTSLNLENVQVRIHWNHPRSTDLRVTVVSPGGTRSILHRPGAKPNSVPEYWTYSSVRYLGESSLGVWTVSVVDQGSGMTGQVYSVELTLSGVTILDRDADGLDDEWEMRHFGTLKYGSKDDPDGDGWSNAVEQLIGSNPALNDRPLVMDISFQTRDRLRLSWPGTENLQYRVEQSAGLNGPWSLFKQVPRVYPESALYFTPGDQPILFRVRTLP